MAQLRCPFCGVTLRVEPKALGKRKRCPNCRNAMTIQTLPARRRRAVQTPELIKRPATRRGEPPPVPPKRSNLWLSPVLVSSCFAVILAGFTATGVWLYLDRRGPPETADSGSLGERGEANSAGNPERERDAGALSVTVQKVREVYGADGLGFQFRWTEPLRGRPRLIGVSPEGLTTIELITDDQTILEASISTHFSTTDEGSRLMNSLYFVGFLGTAIPEWDGYPDWASEAIERVVNEGSVETTVNGIRVKMEAIQGFSVVQVKMAPI